MQTEDGGIQAALSDRTERYWLWKRVTKEESTLEVREQRIVSTLCYTVYNLMTDKINENL